MKLISVVVLTILSLNFVGCIRTVGGSGGYGLDGNFYTHEEEVMAFVNTYNAQSDYKIDVVKVSTGQYNYAVFKYVGYDQYFVADMSKFEVGQDIFRSACNYYGCIPDIIADTDLYYSFKDVTTKGVFGIYTDESGLQYEAGASTIKDLELLSAFSERAANSVVADHLVSEYGLSEKRSMSLAKLMSNWATVSGQRELTEADSDLISQQVFGVDYHTLKNAATSGNINSEENNDFINRAAEANEISPEHMRSIVGDIFNKF